MTFLSGCQLGSFRFFRLITFCNFWFVIIVQDIGEANITLNDPAFAESSFTVSLEDFQLAWLAADNSFASIVRIQ